MKKILFLCIFLLSSLSNVKALVEIELGEPIIKFEKERDYVLQGFSTVKDKLFTVFINEDETKPLIKIFDLKDNSFVKEIKTNSVGHANDVTYNSKENKVYIAHGNGEKIVHVFDGSTYERLEDKTISLPIRSITYIEDENRYAVRTVASGFYLSKDLELNNKYPFVIGMNFMSNVARQGWTYYDGMLFYSTWSWIRLGGNGTNSIYVYNIEGNYLDTIVTKEDIGEVEDVAFYDNKMILGINTYDDYIVFYSIDVPTVNKEPVIDEVKEETIRNNNIFIIVCSIVGGLLLIIAIVYIMKKKM